MDFRLDCLGSTQEHPVHCSWDRWVTAHWPLGRSSSHVTKPRMTTVKDQHPGKLPHEVPRVSPIHRKLPRSYPQGSSSIHVVTFTLSSRKSSASRAVHILPYNSRWIPKSSLKSNVVVFLWHTAPQCCMVARGPPGHWPQNSIDTQKLKCTLQPYQAK